MSVQLLGLFLTVAMAGAFGQFEFPGLYGKITTRIKSGDFAPDISYTKALHNGAADPWASGKLSGQVTVLQFLPYVSGNPQTVDQWNSLVREFADQPVQFVWIAGEKDSTLLPFLKDHPIQGWIFNDVDGATGRAYGLENPQSIFIDADRKILGFGESLIADEELKAVLEKGAAAARLSAEPHRMPQPGDHRPDFPPSYTVHIDPAKNKLDSGNYGAMDYWSLQGYTVKRLLSEVLDASPIRIDLPASIDPDARYDFSIVLPKNEDREAMRNLIRQGVEDHFHIEAIHENRLRDVYVLTATAPKLSAAKRSRSDGGGFSSSMGFRSIGKPGLDLEAPSLDAITDLFMDSATLDQLCDMMERTLDRPVVNETKLEGEFDFEVREPEASRQALPKGDFTERLREQLGLAITPAQRSVDTVVYRLR